MRRTAVLWAVLCLVAAIPAAGPRAEEEGQAAEFEEMMAMMAKLAQPGPEHELLTSMAGEWKIVNKSWMGPGEPMINEGSSTITAVLGGRFIQEDLEGTFMEKPFRGMGLTGYDNAAKQYVSIWADTMGTGLYMSRGTYDDASRTLRMSMKFENPVTGQLETARIENKFLDDGGHVFSMYENHEGQEVKTMEITYTRK